MVETIRKLEFISLEMNKNYNHFEVNYKTYNFQSSNTFEGQITRKTTAVNNAYPRF